MNCHINFNWTNHKCKVRLAGSFNGWTQVDMKLNPPSTYTYSIGLNEGLHRYKFKVDETWHYDDTKPFVNDGFGGYNNILEIRSIKSLYNNRTEEGKSVNCPICLDSSYDLYELQCKHTYCKSCLRSHIESEINDSEYEIECPNNDCEHNILYQEINQLVHDSMISKFDKNILRHTVATSDNLIFCPKCENVCEKSGENYVVCENCNYQFCVSCQFNYDSDHECSNIDIGDFQGIIKESSDVTIQLKHCPVCNEVSYKCEGCDCIKCPKCRYRYCWNCLTLTRDIEDEDEHQRSCQRYNSFRDDDSSDPD